MSDDSAPDVSIVAWDVKIRGSPKLVDTKYGGVVRALSSYGRAVVRYAPCVRTLLESVRDVLHEAVSTADAERHLRDIEAQHNEKAAPRNAEVLFVQDIYSILVSKTKRLKQHSKRSKLRAEKKSSHATGVQSWPKGVLTAAIEFHDWDQDLFMHIAMKVMAGYFDQQGLQVQTKDGIRVWQLREDIKELLEKHGKCIGVSEYELIETAN